MEKQLLPNAALKPAYDKIVWLYVYRDFSGSPRDLAAERVAIRFSLTAWPQHFLVDPSSLRILADTGRTTDSFLASVRRSKVTPTAALEAANRVEQAEKRAIELEERQDPKLARERMADDDIVVRYRALQILAKKDPATVAANAQQLLQIPHDQIRFMACGVLAKSGDQRAARALEAIAREPSNSRNPNVLRMQAVQALATCGDEKSVPVIQPFATSGNYLNMLTGVSVGALSSIAARYPSSRARVRDLLKDAYPKPANESDTTRKRPSEILARKVHSALNAVSDKTIPFPNIYDDAARERLRQLW